MVQRVPLDPKRLQAKHHIYYNPLTWTTRHEPDYKKRHKTRLLAAPSIMLYRHETLRDGPKGPLDQKDFRAKNS